MSKCVKKAFKILLALLIMIFFISFIYGQSKKKDLVASLALLPGLVDSPEKGSFVDLVKAIDKVYTEGTIKIEVYPFTRSINNVIKGKADFHLPNIRNPIIPESKLPFRYVNIPLGPAPMVIYSNIEKKITGKMINDALDKGGKFPYVIELAGGLQDSFPFPNIATNDILQSLKKVQGKRIDAVIFGPEEGDQIVKANKMKNIYRALWANLDDVITIPKGPRGDTANKILTDALLKLKRSGKLKKLHLKIHQPYNNWQPSKMGW
jgi:polar amino acid transport system substrate-binding protein